MDCNSRMANSSMMNGRMSYRMDQMGMMPGNGMMCNDGCNKGNEPVDSMALTMAYVPWQDWGEVYELERALGCGTIFPELNKPFVGRGGRS